MICSRYGWNNTKSIVVFHCSACHGTATTFVILVLFQKFLKGLFLIVRDSTWPTCYKVKHKSCFVCSSFTGYVVSDQGAIGMCVEGREDGGGRGCTSMYKIP